MGRVVFKGLVLERYDVFGGERIPRFPPARSRHLQPRPPCRPHTTAGAGLDVYTKDIIVKQPYLPIITSVDPGVAPAPPKATNTTNPAQCGTANCMLHVGCFANQVGGVQAVPNPALITVTVIKKIKSVVGTITIKIPTLQNSGWTPLTCAQYAKQAGADVFAMQTGDQCYTGGVLSDAISQGPATTCTAACSADTSQSNCGGGSDGSASVYTVF